MKNRKMMELNELPPAIERSLQELLLNLGHLAAGDIYIDIYPITPGDPESPYTADISNQGSE